MPVKKRATIGDMEQTLTIEAAEKLLTINKHELDEEVSRHVMFSASVVERFINAVDHRDTLKHDYELVKAAADQGIRGRASKNGEKLTEASIQHQVLLNDDVVAAYREYLTAKTDAESWLAMKELWHSRAYMLQYLTQLYIGNYWNKSSIQETRDDHGTHECMTQQRKALTRKVSRA